MSKWYCYMITAGPRTYIGKTNDLRRRLRQHNSIISGGAKATRGRGPWRIVWYVRGFISERHALQFEWRLHNPPTRRFGIIGRTKCLIDVCTLPRCTSKAPPAHSIRLHVKVAPSVLGDIRRHLEQLPRYMSWSAIPGTRLAAANTRNLNASMCD